MAPGDLDPSFLALSFAALGDVALARAGERGCTHADFRFERNRTQSLRVRDLHVQTAATRADVGFAVRVIFQGAWGFASGVELSNDEVARVTDRAIAVAEVASAMTTTPVELAPEPVYADVSWSSGYQLHPWDVATVDKTDLLLSWSERLRGHPAVQHASVAVEQVAENKYYCDLAGSRIIQQRIRVLPEFEAHGVDDATGVFDSMRSLAPPVGRGWEFLVDGWDWDTELDQAPELLAEKLRAPSVEAGDYDLVIDPSNLWLTIHESIGHATELDRALGYEANYAGTSFATYDQLGSLRYGSPLMQVTGDRTVEHGLATVGYDDDGVATQSWDIVRDGVLVGYQTDRAMSRLKPELNGGRSNGCAFADSPGHVPIQRMANVSLQPDPVGPDTAGLIGGVDRGLFIVGDRSWSIDMQRFNFQFTGQRFYRIENGALAGQVRDVAYQATTTDFWGSMAAVGGPSTWVLGGAGNCGKAQPGQVAAVSHGCPAALFEQVRVLNTVAEGGH